MPGFNLIDGNNVFIHAFHKHQNMDTMISDFIRMSCHPNEKTLWVWDGIDSRAYRRGFFPEYKLHRDNKPKDPEIFPLMRDFKHRQLPSIAGQVEIPGWEADDVLFNIALHGGAVINRIYSTDVDLTAIGKLQPNIQFPMANPIPNLPYEFVCMYKTLVGDSSDGIKGIPGFGPKMWEKIPFAEIQALELMLENGKPYCGIEDIPEKIHNMLREHWQQVELCYKLVKFRPCPKDDFLGLLTKHAIRQVVRL